MPRTRFIGYATLALLLLAGCAGWPVVIPRPQDFPLHSTDDPFFDLDWRLDTRDGVVEAVGLVTATRVDGIASVWLQLQELDPSGEVVKTAIGRAYDGDGLGTILRWQSRSFAVSLRPKDPNDRFQVKVWSYEWDGTRDRKGKN